MSRLRDAIALNRSISKKSRASSAARPAFVEPLEGRDLYSVTPVGHALPARGVPAPIPVLQMSARPTSHASSLGASQRPAAGPQPQRLVVIAQIGILLGLLLK